jgi:hypothetical protein
MVAPQFKAVLIAGAIDFSHASRAEGGEDLVRAKL